MQLNIQDLITRYEEELRLMTRRTILAEAELATLKTTTQTPPTTAPETGETGD